MLPCPSSGRRPVWARRRHVGPRSASARSVRARPGGHVLGRCIPGRGVLARGVLGRYVLGLPRPTEGTAARDGRQGGGARPPSLGWVAERGVDGSPFVQDPRDGPWAHGNPDRRHRWHAHRWRAHGCTHLLPHPLPTGTLTEHAGPGIPRWASPQAVRMAVPSSRVRLLPCSCPVATPGGTTRSSPSSGPPAHASAPPHAPPHALPARSTRRAIPVHARGPVRAGCRALSPPGRSVVPGPRRVRDPLGALRRPPPRGRPGLWDRFRGRDAARRAVGNPGQGIRRPSAGHVA